MSGDAAGDDQTKAAVAIAWVIILNKPFYPLYVWWLLGTGVPTACLTLVAFPFFLALPFLERRSGFYARLGLPLLGAIDTVFETFIFGRDSATLLFLAPCMMLVALLFQRQEKWWQRGSVAFVFLCFAAGWWLSGPPAFPWTAGEIHTLLNVNVFAVASLMGFIGLRFSGLAGRS